MPESTSAHFEATLIPVGKLERRLRDLLVILDSTFFDTVVWLFR